jgi:excisionase family DNA binding protein
VATKTTVLANPAKDGSVSDTEREAWQRALNHDKHLTPEELAEREGVPLETVYGWNKTGKGPQYMKIGRHCRYALADVLAWEKTRIVERSGAA